MKLGITCIQRNRNAWIVEWLAFHMAVGFNKFFIYAHKCDDGMEQTLLKLSMFYDIKVYNIDVEHRPQLAAYQHSWDINGQDVDWMAFIDGDEFLLPTRHRSMVDALAGFCDAPLSALAAYWMCYGSSGHLDEPQGLILENFRRHSGPDFPNNRHVKSIVRGGERIRTSASHVFETERGTFDDRMRPVTHGYMRSYEPSYDTFRINHYATQSFEFYAHTKQRIGAADHDPTYVRPIEWFQEYDRNECDDGVVYNFLIPVKLKMRELQAVLNT